MVCVFQRTEVGEGEYGKNEVSHVYAACELERETEKGVCACAVKIHALRVGVSLVFTIHISH